MLLSVFLLWSVVHAHTPSPFDIRIDHYKVDTVRDLVINTPRPRFSWKFRIFDDVLHRNIHQTAYEIQLQSTRLSKRDQWFQWDSGRVNSSQSIHVPYTGSEDLSSSTYYRFRLRVWTTINSNDPSEWIEWIPFRTSLFDLHQHLTNNVDIQWIGSTKINMNELRKEFNVSNTSPIKAAIVYMCGLGYYQFYLNGNNVDPSRKLDPGWTTYEKRTLIVSFDVTANITTGMNAVGVKLGNGWYSHEQHMAWFYGPPRLLFNLTITFENGEQMQVFSDQTWRGREGSIKHDSVYNGEIYDSRSDRPKWAQAGFTDALSAWIVPESLSSPILNASIGFLVLQDMLPIRAGPDALHFEVKPDASQQGYLNVDEIGDIQGASLMDGGIMKPVAVWSSASGVRTFDLGQNMAGWCRFKFNGPSGFGTYIRHAELIILPVIPLNRSTNNIYIENLHNATASETYILRGDPAGEIYEPTFTVHGFRYFSVYGPPNKLSTDDVECLVVHSETTLKGHFSSSNPVINQIQHNIQWGQLSNLMSLPTDCPQRNERRGWMGDAGLSVNEALYNFDLIKFYQNYLNLIGDMQLENGQIPDIVPGGLYPADPNWGTAFPTITWQLYRHYQDPKILEPYYNRIRAYIESLRNGYNTTSLANMFFRWGDWLPPSPYPQTNKSLTSSYAFLHDVDLLVNMSQVLNKTDDTTFYSTFYQQLTEEFHRVFFNTTSNCYADGMQTAQVLPLALRGVVPQNLRKTVVDYLVSDISQKGNHTTSGIVGVAQVYPVLSDNGHHDLALEMISSTTYPSYGYMFNNGRENATTLWEVWNADGSGILASHNHIMYGSVGAWFYSHLAGIELSSDFITIRPRMVSETKKYLMKKLNCQLSTLHGLVHVTYTRDERDTISNSVLLRVTIPPNAKARVMFEPLFVDAQCNKLMEGGKMIWSSDASTPNSPDFKIEKDSATHLMVVHIGSGQYEFQATWQ